MAILQQQIIDALITALGEISTANGYETEIGSNVSEWDIARDTVDELPAVDVRDHDTIDVSSDGGFFNYEMPVDIIVTTSGSTSKSEARKMIYDVYAAVGSDPSFGNLADNSFPQSHEIGAEHEANLISRVVIKVLIKFSTANWSSE